MPGQLAALYHAFSQVSALASWMFIFYVVLTFLGVLNVIAAVFVEVTVCISFKAPHIKAWRITRKSLPHTILLFPSARVQGAAADKLQYLDDPKQKDMSCMSVCFVSNAPMSRVPNVPNMFRSFRAFQTIFSSERFEQWCLVPGNVTRYKYAGPTRYTVHGTWYLYLSPCSKKSG